MTATIPQPPAAKVSVLMLTHNAPDYVRISLDSLARTEGVEFELILVDNASDAETRDLVAAYAAAGAIDRFELLDYNSLFAEGNNRAAALASADATHFLLLNSDVEIRNEHWLSALLAVHRRGITSYGIADDPVRVDGYCLLIDADLYRAHPLDEEHQWWWSVTKLQAALLREGHSVQGYRVHERWLHHFGGRSGDGFKSARGMEVTREQVLDWFDGHRATVLDEPPAPSAPPIGGTPPRPRALRRVWDRVRRRSP